MKGPRIRDAVAADLPAIVALLADDMLGASRERADALSDPAYRAAFNAIAADPNNRLVVMEQDGRIIGTLQLTWLPGLSHHGAWRAQIEAVRIASELRGQGLGSRFIAWAVEAAAARGCRMVQLTSNKSRTEAHRFYGALGFVNSHEGFKRDLAKPDAE